MLTFLAAALVSQAQPLPNTIVEALRKNGHFKDTLRMLHTTGLDQQLDSDASYMLIAVTDETMKKLPPKVREAIVTEDRFASLIARTHLVKGKYGTISFVNGISADPNVLRKEIKNLMGGTLVTRSITRPANGGLFIGKAKVQSEIYSMSGCTVVVDRLLPVEMPRPKVKDFERALPPELIAWGLGRYK